MTDSIPPFHLAFPVHDLEPIRQFYVDVIGCRTGRSAERWIDFDLYGHQVVAHVVDRADPHVESSNLVDGKDVPVPHFGVVLPWSEWEQLADRLKAATVTFVIEPCIRFEGEAGEQATMFLLDPSGNALEFKAFRDPTALFAT